MSLDNHLMPFSPGSHHSLEASSSASSTVLKSLHDADESFCMLFPMLLDQTDTFIDGDRWTKKSPKAIAVESVQNPNVAFMGHVSHGPACRQ
jgi:hypothetical protein